MSEEAGEEERRLYRVIIEGCLDAVHEEYVLPLTLALGTLTAAACRDPDRAPEVAAALRRQAESCPPGGRGRLLLEALAGLAGEPQPPRPDAVQSALRASLRLVRSSGEDSEG